ncbi:beta-N-acetylhexosaminidase [Actinoplanes sp. TFC3]|uniref:beta-N-acetylhexosaminidase n=1 Tax=Actinoplanes sp. TFC3 TaxID=1710355 RepID=UPI0009E70572|nr:beta-N-acetylhexosaminidase [Actinoplanes sp. TFC3]
MIVPAPVRYTESGGPPYELSPRTRIVLDDPALHTTASLLAERLRVSTGFPIPVVTQPVSTRLAGTDDVELMIGELTGPAEAYLLTAGPRRVTITGASAAGVLRGIQTLLQMLPPAVFAGSAVQPAPRWTVPSCRIADHPRFAHRGLMLDPARSFLGVPEVKRLVDALVLVKGNRLHLHLTDDQGWRIEIRSWPNLTAHGGTGAVAGCPSGFYTQDDYAEIVRYAADRHVLVVPEIDVPGHTTAAVSSYPELHGGGPPIPLMTTDGVGTVALDVEREVTYAFLDDVIREVAALTPGPYLHIGGDEVVGMPEEQYAAFLRRARRIVASYGKTMIGWTPVPKAGLDAGVVHQYWADRAGETTQEWFAGGRPVLLSPTFRTYLDYGFAPGYGIKYTDRTTRAAYEWDPADVIDETTGRSLHREFGLTEAQTQGVEAAIWGETMRRGGPDVETAVWPRLAAIMEKAWSPAGDFDDFASRMAALGARLRAMGIRFWPDPEIAWDLP